LTSPAAKAFDLSLEPEKSYAKYNNSRFGLGCLLARRAIEAGTAAGGGRPTPHGVDPVSRMEELADRARRLPDARVQWLVDWVRREMCPKLPALGAPSAGALAEWKPRRMVIFTEYADTKRYLEQQLKAAIGTTDQGDDRLATFHGGMPDAYSPSGYIMSIIGAIIVVVAAMKMQRTA